MIKLQHPDLRRYYKLLAIALLFFIPLFYYAVGYTVQKRTQQVEVQKQTLVVETQKYPVHLMIPAIGVNALIQHVGVTPEGEMEVPSNIVDVGWFKFGFRPGENGNAVIAGHFNGENGEAGVFANLNKLKKGDKIYVEDNKRILTVFVVRETRFYDVGSANEVFGQSAGAHLNLITCFGVWNDTKNSYNKRLVVVSDAIF